MIEADVVVAGGGPAGAALAITLAATGAWRVVLVDRAAPSSRSGETLPGAARAVLRDLGVLRAFEEDGHPRTLGQASVWGSSRLDRRDAFADPNGAAWRLDRAKFEGTLVAAAVRQGCQWMRPAVVTGLSCDGGARRPWRVQTETSAGEKQEVRCRFVVDATGRRASLARRLGALLQRTDNLICDTLVLPRVGASAPAATGFEGTSDIDGFSIVEAAADGWFYGARLASGECLISFHTDFDLAGPGPPDAAALLARASSSSLMGRLAGGTTRAPPATRVAAWSARLTACVGPGWAVAGDAACCFDPLSSQGVFNALYGGLRLGQAIGLHLRSGDDSRLTHYAQEVKAVWSAYRHHHRMYCAGETRWQGQPFWQRRVLAPEEASV